jgi:hypothetical protein
LIKERKVETIVEFRRPSLYLVNICMSMMLEVRS